MAERRTCQHLGANARYLKMAIPDELDEDAQRSAFVNGLIKLPDHVEFDIKTVHKCVAHPLADSHFWVVAIKERGSSELQSPE